MVVGSRGEHGSVDNAVQSATGPVVQAGRIGEVHFHERPRWRIAPDQLPRAPRASSDASRSWPTWTASARPVADRSC
ncbi:hypothetical protein ACFQV2_31400 [Actinokineospora soli]|uniref:Uncharacterized protein n=1 Tax=Actinokineospora soli TaxID=1048753 RepID=A0ABW2TVB6_9PSEU